MNPETEIKALRQRLDALEASLKEPELIQGYTREQWQQIEDGKFLCEFCDAPFDDERCHQHMDLFSGFMSYGAYAFKDSRGIGWKFCRPLRSNGVKQPWFGGECPVDPESEVVIYLRGGQTRKAEAGDYVWHHNGHAFDITAFIEL